MELNTDQKVDVLRALFSGGVGVAREVGEAYSHDDDIKAKDILEQSVFFGSLDLEKERPSLQDVREAFMEELANGGLPSGSGFNGKWDISFDEKKRLYRCKNSYDFMNEVGMYDTSIDFTVSFKEAGHFEEGFSLKFNHLSNHQRYVVEMEDLRSYIEETVFTDLEMNMAKKKEVVERFAFRDRMPPGEYTDGVCPTLSLSYDRLLQPHLETWDPFEGKTVSVAVTKELLDSLKPAKKSKALNYGEDKHNMLDTSLSI